MSSEIDKLVEVITDLVLSELDSRPEAPRAVAPTEQSEKKSGIPVLVCPGPRAVDGAFWTGLTEAGSLSPSVLVWTDFRADQLGSQGSHWKLETRVGRWDKVASAYRAVVLLGSDLGVLSAIGNLGSGSVPPASVAVAGLASGLPVFLDNSCYESLRRHSSRLASGFVGRFEEYYRLVGSFGIEFGGPTQLAGFLARLGGGGAPANPADRSAGRAVITVEDVEAVKRSGGKRMEVAMGTIVTPLAAQRATEWGVEVVVQ